MEKHKKLFKKWFLRFKNTDLEQEFQNKRRESSYIKFKKFNILISVSHLSLFAMLYLVGQFRKGYRENQEDATCKLRTDYMAMFMLPIMIGSIQIDTIFMKFKILQWMRGTLTLLVFFIGTTEMSIDKFADMKSQSVEFGQITYLVMLAIYVGKEIIKYWERATITYLLGLLYFFARHLQLGKSVYMQVLIITPMHLLIMGFLYYNFELSERKLFYLHYLADKKEKEWSKLFGKMLVGLIIRNKRRKIKYCNNIAKRLIGVDDSCQEMDRGTEIEIIMRLIAEIDASWKANKLGTDKIAHEIMSRENERIYLEISKMSFELDNEGCKVYIINDVTLAKRIQLDIIKNAEEKDIFFASMSHELRNPLNSLLVSIDIFKKSNSIDPEIIETAQTCGETLLNIIGNILDVSKIENQKLDISPSGGNLIESVTKVVLMMRGLAEKKGLYLKFKPETTIHKYYLFDHTRLNQVLINLIGNAIKFTDKGGIKIQLDWFPEEEVKTDQDLILSNLDRLHENNYNNFLEDVVYDVGNITEGVEEINNMNMQLECPPSMRQLNTMFSTENLREERKSNLDVGIPEIYEEEEVISEEGKMLEAPSILSFADQRGFMKIQILDSGAGISKADILKLFNPFSQAENSRKKFGGTGLGLWISDNIIKKMGGSLKVVSEENVGSSFVIVIPLEKYNYNIQRPEIANISDILKRSRILMVEDDDSYRKLMGELLERSGSSVYLANNGQTGLEIFKNMSEETAPNRYFTAILTDLRMPNQSGQNLIMSIRKYEKTSHLEETPIIVISGDPSENEKAKCLQVLGANKFLSKPVTLYMIEKALIEILNAQTGHEETLPMMQQIVEERKLQILVVDDDIYCSHIFTRQLIDYNYPSFHAVYSGFEVYIYIYTQSLLGTQLFQNCDAQESHSFVHYFPRFSSSGFYRP